MFGEIARFFSEGGTFMYINLLIGVGSLALIIERFYFLQFKWSINDRTFVDRIYELVRKGDVAGAKKMCDDSPVPRIVASALDKSGRPAREIQNAVDETAMDILPHVEKRLPYLPMAANLATLLGLLGTVRGLIQSLNAVAGAEPSQKGALLALGLAEAMNNTAFALIIAIPCLAAFAFLHARSNRLVEQVDRTSARMVNLLAKD
jgi:biopolymer transport protein ExbB